MGIEIIDGFRLNANKPLDERAVVEDEAARLLIKWVSIGLLCYQKDTGDTYQYIGAPPSNLVGDWDIFTSIGDTGATGADGADGEDGDKKGRYGQAGQSGQATIEDAAPAAPGVGGCAVHADAV